MNIIKKYFHNKKINKELLELLEKSLGIQTYTIIIQTYGLEDPVLEDWFIEVNNKRVDNLLLQMNELKKRLI